MKAPIPAEQLTIVPANDASWEDLQAIFGTTDAGYCQCQRFKVLGWIWRDSTQDERTAILRAQTACGNSNAAATNGLVAYIDDEPVGWVAVEPRTAYPKLRTSRVPWTGRHEDKGDDGIWAVTCLVVRKGYRGRGLHVGARQVFEDAGFKEIGRPTVRRVVMRIDFDKGSEAR